MNEKLKDWDDRRREYLGGAIATILALSSAALAFSASLLTQETVILGGCKSAYIFLAVIFFVLGIAAGLAVTFTRLHDARVTAKIVRAKMKNPTSGYLESLRNNADYWGKITWKLLYLQFGLFILGALFLMLSLFLIFGPKFFP